MGVQFSYHSIDNFLAGKQVVSNRVTFRALNLNKFDINVINDNSKSHGIFKLVSAMIEDRYHFTAENQIYEKRHEKINWRT